MIANFDLLAPVIPPRRSPNLTLHCGASHVDLEEVRAVSTPRHTDSWCPIPHHQLITTVQRTLATTNLRIGTQAHSLLHEGSVTSASWKSTPRKPAMTTAGGLACGTATKNVPRRHRRRSQCVRVRQPGAP